MIGNLLVILLTKIVSLITNTYAVSHATPRKAIPPTQIEPDAKKMMIVPTILQLTPMFDMQNGNV